MSKDQIYFRGIEKAKVIDISETPPSYWDVSFSVGLSSIKIVMVDNEIREEIESIVKKAIEKTQLFKSIKDIK